MKISALQIGATSVWLPALSHSGHDVSFVETTLSAPSTHRRRK